MSIVTRPLREGFSYKYSIYAVGERASGGPLNCPTFDFISHAEQHQPTDLLRLSAVLDYLAENGSLRNEKKFKHVTGSDQIFEMKTANGLRLFCFFDVGRVIVCTSGVIKKKQKANPKDIETAEDWRKRYFTARESGKLQHESEHDPY